MKKTWISLWITCLLTGSSVLVGAETVYNGTAGNGNDNQEITFCFQSQNIPVRLLKPDGSALASGEVNAAYGTAFRIASEGEDWLARIGLEAIGADLGGSLWTQDSYPALGQVAVDPANGRIKFAASGWEPAVRLNAMATDAEAISVAINQHGQALCARREQGPGWFDQVYVNAYDPSTGWQNPVAVDTGNTNTGNRAHVALNDSGVGLCLLEDGSGNATRIMLNTYAVGTGWQGAVQVDKDIVAVPASRGVLLNNTGQGALFFSESTASHIYARVLDPATGWGDVDTISFNGQRMDTGMSMAINDAGKMVCAFSQSTTAYYRVYAAVYQPGMGWSTPRVMATMTGDANSPSVAINQDGMIVCAFLQAVGNTFRLYAGIYNPETGWQAATAIDGISNTVSSASPLTRTDLTLDDNGRALCAFTRIDLPNNNSLCLSEYRRGSGWQAPVLLATKAFPIFLATATIGQSENGRLLYTTTYYDIVTPVAQPAFMEYSPASGWGPLTDFGPSNSLIDAMAMNDQGFVVAGLRQDPFAVGHAYGDVFRVESPVSLPAVNYSYQSLTLTPAPTPASPAEAAIAITGREIKPLQNRPARLAFDLNQDGRVTIQIYSLTGERVRTLVNAYYTAGRYTATWGAENDRGQLVASGIYVIQVKIPGLEKKQKVAVVK